MASAMIYMPPLVLAILAYWIFACPRHLRHLPRVPVWPTLLSFLSGETDADRLRRLVLPYADAHGHGLVLLWMLGDWYIHVLDPKVSFLTDRDSRYSWSVLAHTSSYGGKVNYKDASFKRHDVLEVCWDQQRCRI